MTDLDKLIAAVEAGDETALYAALRTIASAARDKGEYWPAHDATKAYDGSLDAALQLHEALLPGWGWGATCVGAYVCEDHHPAEEPERAFYADNSTLPARAWLLAVLRALREGESQK